MAPLKLYLASASARRRELLQQIGFEPVLVPHAAEEAERAGEGPIELVKRLARSKGLDALSRLEPGSAPGVLLAADTAVAIGGEILGKPRDPTDARRMLERLRGAQHCVHTGLFLVRTDDSRSVLHVETTRVVFRDYEDAEIALYVASGEPRDKAGAYGIQGRGALLAERIEGSWSNVVGLPLERLPRCLADIGVDPTGLMLGELAAR